MDKDAVIADLITKVTELTQYVKILEARLSKYETPKNSGNSSVAPSQGPFRKTRSLRRGSKKPPRGQGDIRGVSLKWDPWRIGLVS
jgi:hypothetical protein